MKTKLQLPITEAVGNNLLLTDVQIGEERYQMLLTEGPGGLTIAFRKADAYWPEGGSGEFTINIRSDGRIGFSRVNYRPNHDHDDVVMLCSLRPEVLADRERLFHATEGACLNWRRFPYREEPWELAPIEFGARTVGY